MNLADLRFIQPDRDELSEPAPFADDAQRAVPGVDQGHGRLNDLPERDLKFQVAADRHDGLEQRMRAVPGGQHRLQPDLQLGEQFVEPHVRHYRVALWCLHRRLPASRCGNVLIVRELPRAS